MNLLTKKLLTKGLVLSCFYEMTGKLKNKIFKTKAATHVRKSTDEIRKMSRTISVYKSVNCSIRINLPLLRKYTILSCQTCRSYTVKTAIPA